MVNHSQSARKTTATEATAAATSATKMKSARIPLPRMTNPRSRRTTADSRMSPKTA